MNPPESYTEAIKAEMTDIHETETVTPYVKDFIPVGPAPIDHTKSFYDHDITFKNWLGDIEPLFLKTLSQAHLNMFYYAFKAGEGYGKQKAIENVLDKLRRLLS